MLRLTSQMISQSNVKGVFSGHSWSGWATLPWLMYFNIPIFLSLSTPSSTVYQRSSCILASCSINYFLIHVSGNQPNTLLELFLTHQPEKLNPEPLLTWPILINPEWAKYIFLSPFSFTLFILSFTYSPDFCLYPLACSIPPCRKHVLLHPLWPAGTWV